jgi:diketogulonate reductase-like aldo/keto reductase
MNTLSINVTPKLKTGSLHEFREDGQSYSFTFTAGNKVFQSAHFFGNEEVQERALKKIVDGWPSSDKICIVTNSEEDL